MSLPISDTPYSRAARLSESEFPANFTKKYGKASQEEFDKHYSSEGWFCRKFIAIPAALTALVRELFHLLRPIFTGEMYEGKYPDIFRAKWDLMEAAGWMITLVDDRLGSYAVQESQFQRECCDHYVLLQKAKAPAAEAVPQESL